MFFELLPVPSLRTALFEPLRCRGVKTEVRFILVTLATMLLAVSDWALELSPPPPGLHHQQYCFVFNSLEAGLLLVRAVGVG